MVLIETLWNVKDDILLYGSSYVGVLIETLWNVKTNSRSCQTMEASRY